jgi:hypothetical protein
MLCENCDFENNNAVRFCENCGARLRDKNKWFPKTQKGAKVILRLVVATVICLLLAAISLFFMYVVYDNYSVLLWAAEAGFVLGIAIILWYKSWYKHYREYRKKQPDYNEAEEMEAEHKAKKAKQKMIIIGIILSAIQLIMWII